MQYSFKEIHALNLLSDNPEYSKRFNTPADLKIMTTITLLVVGTVVACAIVFKVDKIVPAQGVLETQAKLFEVRGPRSGLVETIHVREGAEVAAGDALVSFDTELMDLDIERLEQELTTLSRSVWTDFYQIRDWLPTRTLHRLNITLSDLPNPVETLGYQDFLSQALHDTLSGLDQSLKGLDTRQAALERQIDLTRRQLAMETDELERIKRLYKQGIESRSGVDAGQRVVLDLQSALESLAAERDLAGSEQDTLIVEREKLLNDFVRKRLLRIQDQLDQYRQAQTTWASLARERRDMTVRAPFAAIVDEVQARGRHEVLDAGAALAVLRPLFDPDDLEIDIQIPSNYAIWVEPGMEFRASSLGNNPEDHGRLHGVVGFVSKSSEVIEGQRIYRMTGTITKMAINNADTFLRPGLQLSVEIKAGERRLINYIFDPFTKHFRTALSEPS